MSEFQPKIKAVNAENFIIELWQKITDTGFNALTKNDINDFILYLYNKHSGGQFLDDRSNYENALLLKITETKLKTTRLNIGLKFQSPDERRKTLYLFFQKIKDKIIPIEDKIDYFEFTLDNPVVRMEIENILKKSGCSTLEYGRNRERVRIEKYHMFTILKELTKCTDTQIADNIKKELRSHELKNKIISTASTLMEKIGGVLKEITVEVLTGVLTNTLKPV
jgi:hypothetical protein